MNHWCGQFAETLISGYLDGVIPPGDRRQVRSHLQRCAGCRRLLRDLRELRETLLATRAMALARRKSARSTVTDVPRNFDDLDATCALA